MKQAHTEEAVRHTDDEQNTGNHKKPGTPEAKQREQDAGHRTGAGNVEPTEAARPSR